jgi:prolycopene isomerase
MANQAKKTWYDVIVVGGGLAGLTCGAFLAKSGKSVLVLEKEPTPGGCCSSFERQGFTFDVGVHFVLGAGPEGSAGKLLRALGVSGLVEFVKVDPMYRAVFPDFSLDVPLEWGSYQDLLCKRFPNERQGLSRLWDEMKELYDQMYAVPDELTFWDKARFPLNFTLLANYSGRTFQAMLDDSLHDPRLKAVVSSVWPFIGCPPSRVSAVYMSGLLATCFLEKAYYPKGGSGRLSQALAGALARHGGELVTQTEVARILVKGGRACGVELVNGERLGAFFVVSASDSRRTFLNLVGERYLKPGFVKKLKAMRSSFSVCETYLGISLSPQETQGLSHQVFSYDSYDMDEAYQRMLSGDAQAPVSFALPSLHDPGLAPAGHGALTLLTYRPYHLVKDRSGERGKMEAQMLSKAEKILPGLEGKIKVRDFSSPQTLERYTHAFSGGPYGWDFTPDQVGIQRLQPVTPIRNLLLAGHWTTPGGGTTTAMVSGLLASKKVLRRYENQKEIMV